MANIVPYKISIPQDQLDRTRQRLELSTFPTQLEDAGWEQGPPLAEIKRLHKYWLEKYDWRAEENKINNALPQFTTLIDVDGFGELNIHFVHKQSATSNAIPLLFVHGWPGSFLEVLKILPDLVSGGGESPAFHVVAPSVPGYGFSEGAKKKGFSPDQCAETLHKLMHKLGYTEYVTQGGDWGWPITRMIGIKYPHSCKASHFNMFSPPQPTLLAHPMAYLRAMTTPLTQADKDGFARGKIVEATGMSYFRQHALKPQTIGYLQTDSPIGLLAWIYEKLVAWTDSYPWTEDEVITWISIYIYATAGPVGGTRLYNEATFAEYSGGKLLAAVRQYVPHVKIGLSRFPKEMANFPMSWNGTLGPVAFEAEHTKGGHFAAWERPEDIVSDLRKMFGKSGGAFAVVPGKNGYNASARL